MTVSNAEQVGIDVGFDGTIDQTYTGSTKKFSITYPNPKSGLKIMGMFYTTSWQNDEVCSVNVEAPQDSEGTGTVSASTTNTVVNQQFWVQIYPAHDDDGIAWLRLKRGTTVLASKYCNGATDCSLTGWFTQHSAGTYDFTGELQDQQGHTYTLNTVTVTVTDPCDDVPPGYCDDGNPCTTDSCVVSGGQATCAHDPVNDGVTCGSGFKCEEGICKALCNTPKVQ